MYTLKVTHLTLRDASMLIRVLGINTCFFEGGTLNITCPSKEEASWLKKTIDGFHKTSGELAEMSEIRPEEALMWVAC